MKYQKLPSFLKRLCRIKYPEGKFINNCDWQVEPDYTLNAIFKGIEINPKVGPFIVDSNIKKIFRPCRL